MALLHASKRTPSLFTGKTDAEAGLESRDGTRGEYRIRPTGPALPRWVGGRGSWSLNEPGWEPATVTRVEPSGFVARFTRTGEQRGFDTLTDATAWAERPTRADPMTATASQTES